MFGSVREGDHTSQRASLTASARTALLDALMLPAKTLDAHASPVLVAGGGGRSPSWRATPCVRTARGEGRMLFVGHSCLVGRHTILSAGISSRFQAALLHDARRA
eukprot:4516793-Pleurochrysis_carterae.AAC.1